MESKTMPRIVALLLAVLLTCTSIFAVPVEAQAATNPTKITLSETKKDLSVGKSFTLKVKSVAPAGASKSVTYKSSNKKVATVNASGKVTGKSDGKATITVTSKASKKVKAKCTVTVRKGVEKVQTAASLVMQKGKKVKLRYDITPNKGVNKKVTFKSGNTKVVKVSKKGKLTALKNGKATITVASADGGAKKKVKVTVKKKITPVTQVTLDQKSLALLNGASDTLHASVIPANATKKNVYYVSSDTSVAVVNNAGRVVAKGDGTAKIYAYACDNMANRAVCTVTVTSPATPPAPIEPTLAVTGVTLDRTSLELNVNGAPYQLLASIEPSNAANRNVTWTTSDEKVATVANGLVTPVATGKATITVTTEDGAKTAACEVTVNPALPGTTEVTGVALNSTAAELEVKGAPYQLAATVMPLNAANKDVTWSTSNASVATVTDGLVTPVTEGTATITVTTADGAKTATCAVTVRAASDEIPVTGVTLNAITADLEVNGAPYQLKATVAPENADNKAVTWSSSSPNVAVVSADGLITPMAAGTTAVTVTTADGSKTAVCNVTVHAAATIPVSSVTLNASSAELEVGGAPFQLLGVVAPKNADNTAITWSSSNTSVATVANGLVTPVAVGTATITVTTADGAKTATCAVTVRAAATIPVTSVRLNETELTLKADDAPWQLQAVVAPLNASNRDITWSSTNPAAATVADGLVSPVAAGTTVITVTTADGSKTATCAVTVTDAPSIPVTGVTLNATSAALEAGGAPYHLIAWVAPQNATNRNVTWTSSDPAVATVADGLVSPVAAGTAVITVTTEDGAKTATCNVTVSEASEIPVTDLWLNSQAVELEEGGASYQLVATVSPVNASNGAVTWATENPRVATVTNGLVSPVSVGSTKITVTTADEKITKEITVNVRPASTIDVTSITLVDTEIEMEVGGAPYLLRKTVEPVNADNPNVTWNATPGGIVTVSEGGVVTPLAVGTATITAVSADGKITSNACTVTVVDPTPIAVTGVSLDCDAEIEMTAGDPAYQVTATVAPANAANKAVTWSSSDEKIATVTADAENGNVAQITPVAPGEATITVTTVDGNKTASCKVIVKPASVTGITVSPKTLELIEGGETGRITADVTSSDGESKAVSWESSDETVATVAASADDDRIAIVTPVKAGTATITATTEDGSKAECTVTVISRINALEENPYAYVYTLDMKNAKAFEVETMWNGRPYKMKESIENVMADYKWFSEQFEKTNWRSNIIKDNWHRITEENIAKIAEHSFIVADVLMGMKTHDVNYKVNIESPTKLVVTVTTANRTKTVEVTRTDDADGTCDLHFKSSYQGKERNITLKDVTISQDKETGTVKVNAYVSGMAQLEGSQLAAQITSTSIKVDRIPAGSTKGTQVAQILYTDDKVTCDINKTYYEEMMGMLELDFNPVEDVKLWNVYTAE